MISTKEKNYLLSLLRDLGKETEKIKTGKIEYELKNDGSPLSEADSLVNNFLNEFIKKTDYQNVISEENKEIDYIHRASWDYFWLVDPIDGTKEFIRGGDDYTINIALCKNNRPIFSIVFAPSRDEFFHAELNSGSFKNNKLIRLKPDKLTTLKVVASKSHINDATKTYINELREKYTIEVKNYGSSLKICKVADGGAHIYPRFSPTMEWDTCAADLILHEAKGKIVATDDHMLTYNKKNLINPYFIAQGCYR